MRAWYSKTSVKGPLLKKTENWFRLMQVKSIAECSKGSILHYFQHSLSYHLYLRTLICLFLSGSFTQVLLYVFQSKVAIASGIIERIFHPLAEAACDSINLAC